MQRLLSIDDLSAMLGVAKATIYSWTSKNKIPHIKLSKRLLKFKEDEIIAWIEKRSIHIDSQVSKRIQNKHKSSKKNLSFESGLIEKIIENAKKEVLT
jgi:excisionase family DNA binding protein